jgi:pyrimidine operon attenuation protein / uracil phosphoribosyltransferase
LAYAAGLYALKTSRRCESQSSSPCEKSNTSRQSRSAIRNPQFAILKTAAQKIDCQVARNSPQPLAADRKRGYAGAMKPGEVLLDEAAVSETILRLAHEISTGLPSNVRVGLIGIRSRGEVLAARLIDLLHELGVSETDHGTLDITLYRDDLAERGPQAILRSTEIDFDINGRYIILVDDVLYTGRSVRAALDALVDLGRPKAIRLAVLVDRPGRELPIQADFVGVRVSQPNVPVTVCLRESDGFDEVRLG